MDTLVNTGLSVLNWYPCGNSQVHNIWQNVHMDHVLKPLLLYWRNKTLTHEAEKTQDSSDHYEWQQIASNTIAVLSLL